MIAAAPAAISTVTTADDGWYRATTSFAQHTGYLHALMSAYTTLSFGLLGLLGLYAWWQARGRADRMAMVALVWTGIGTVVAIAAGLGLKQVFAETRPCLAQSGERARGDLLSRVPDVHLHVRSSRDLPGTNRVGQFARWPASISVTEMNPVSWSVSRGGWRGAGCALPVPGKESPSVHRLLGIRTLIHDAPARSVSPSAL